MKKLLLMLMLISSCVSNPNDATKQAEWEKLKVQAAEDAKSIDIHTVTEEELINKGFRKVRTRIMYYPKIKDSVEWMCYTKGLLSVKITIGCTSKDTVSVYVGL